MRCAADNIPNLAQVFDVYKEILESKGFLQQNGIVQPEEAALFINTVSASSLACPSACCCISSCLTPLGSAAVPLSTFLTHAGASSL